jgi:hypothetical protein
MSEKRSVKLIREEEKNNSSYQRYLDGLASTNPPSTEIFSNKGEAHASILMATLIANTEHNLDMYCTGLRPGILCGEGDDGFKGAYWEEFQHFFNETIKSDAFGDESVRILVQTTEWIDNPPFGVVSNALNDPVTRDKIKVKLISEESKGQIEKILGKQKGENGNYNFAIFDRKAFRLEYEADSYRALGSFNSPSWTRILTNMFNVAFIKAVDITSLVAGGSTIPDKSVLMQKNEADSFPIIPVLNPNVLQGDLVKVQKNVAAIGTLSWILAHKLKNALDKEKNINPFVVGKSTVTDDSVGTRVQNPEMDSFPSFYPIILSDDSVEEAINLFQKAIHLDNQNELYDKLDKCKKDRAVRLKMIHEMLRMSDIGICAAANADDSINNDVTDDKCISDNQ